LIDAGGDNVDITSMAAPATAIITSWRGASRSTDGVFRRPRGFRDDAMLRLKLKGHTAVDSIIVGSRPFHAAECAALKSMAIARNWTAAEARGV